MRVQMVFWQRIKKRRIGSGEKTVGGSERHMSKYIPRKLHRCNDRGDKASGCDNPLAFFSLCIRSERCVCQMRVTVTQHFLKKKQKNSAGPQERLHFSCRVLQSAAEWSVGGGALTQAENYILNWTQIKNWSIFLVNIASELKGWGSRVGGDGAKPLAQCCWIRQTSHNGKVIFH